MDYYNGGIPKMSDDNKSEEPNIYATARKRYNLFTEWATNFIETLDSTPPPDYIRQKYKEHLEEENIDRNGDPLPPTPNEP